VHELDSDVGGTTISVHTEPPGLVIRVRGALDDRGVHLLREVVRAALVTVRHARLIHLDLARVRVARSTPRIVHRLARAGAVVTPPAGHGQSSTHDQHARSAE
jgi:hypothetical protein